ncbi:MAG: ATP-binding protein [Candidatus Hydrogenedentes bacterium]|nr:ATP-binding protein [Candidatus Hydrogenedentota bacterium]
MREDFILIFRSHPRLLKSVRSLIKSYLETLNFSEDRISEIVLGLDEACTNCIRHAYKGRRSGSIQLFVNLGNSWLEFVLRDCGVCPPANFLSATDTREIKSGAPKPHGVGLIILKRTFEQVEFKVDREGRNCLILRTKRPK